MNSAVPGRARSSSSAADQFDDTIFEALQLPLSWIYHLWSGHSRRQQLRGTCTWMVASSPVARTSELTQPNPKPQQPRSFPLRVSISSTRSPVLANEVCRVGSGTQNSCSSGGAQTKFDLVRQQPTTNIQQSVQHPTLLAVSRYRTLTAYATKLCCSLIAATSSTFLHLQT